MAAIDHFLVGQRILGRTTDFESDNGFNMGFPIDIMKSAVCHGIGLGPAIDGRSHDLPGSGLKIGLGHVVWLQ